MEFHRNNFDLIRLVAAFSVLGGHFADHFHFPGDCILQVAAQMFPGVPIFFITSGFLISASYLRSPDLRRYVKARFLRIYPALVLSTLITSGLFVSLGIFNLSWFINQISVLWLYSTPQTIVPFGGGMPNGPMWTVPIEVKFYMLVPLLFLFGRRPGLVVTIMALSLLTMLSDGFGIHHRPDLRHGILYHFWFFGFGILATLYWPRIRPWVAGKVGPWLTAHMVLTAFLFAVLGQQHVLGKLIDGGWTTPALALTLVGLVLSAAHTGKGDLLKGMDISYGLYIYQMPYIHFLKTFWWGGFAAFGATILTAALSWKFLEKPCVAFKRRAVA